MHVFWALSFEQGEGSPISVASGAGEAVSPSPRLDWTPKQGTSRIRGTNYRICTPSDSSKTVKTRIPFFAILRFRIQLASKSSGWTTPFLVLGISIISHVVQVPNLCLGWNIGSILLLGGLGPGKGGEPWNLSVQPGMRDHLRLISLLEVSDNYSVYMNRSVGDAVMRSKE